MKESSKVVEWHCETCGWSMVPSDGAKEVDRQRAECDALKAERDAAIAAIRALVERIERTGGHATPEEQVAYWTARELVGKGRAV